MKNKKALGIIAAVFAAAMSFTVVAPTALAYDTPNHKGFTATRIDVAGSNEALANWQHYFFGETGTNGSPREYAYESENMYMGVTADGHTGNALKLQRNTATGEFVTYSYSFDVESDASYVVSAWVKNTCADVATNLYRFKVKELGDNGYVVSGTDEFADQLVVTGTKKDWTEVKFSYRTNVSGKKLILKILAEGEGDFLVDDITVRRANAGVNANVFGLQSIGDLNNGATTDWQNVGMNRMTGYNIASDSSDGDGASLKLNTEVYKTYFGMLPKENTYKLSFKYKRLSNDATDKLVTILDNFGIKEDGTLERKWDAGVITGGTNEWTSYEYEFSSGNAAGEFLADIQWMGLAAYGHYLIDELAITCLSSDEKMQYLVNGHFSGAYLDGYSGLNAGNSNVARLSDGTNAIVLGNASKDGTTGNPGYLNIDTTKLEQGKTYTLKFDYISGNITPAVRIFYGTYWNDQVTMYADADYPAANGTEWVSKELTFEAGKQVTDRGDGTVRNATRFEIYGPAGGWPTYFRNFSITDTEGNEFIGNKTLVAPDLVLGENVFPYGTFEGNGEYVTDDWTFTGNAGIYGLVFDEPGSPEDWKLRLNGTADAPATAISKDITLTEGTTTLMVDKKVYNGSVETSIIAGETEIPEGDNGLFELPEGTTSIKIKFTAKNGYVALKYVDLQSHAHAAPKDEQVQEKAATCTEFGGRYYTCETCENVVYIEKQDKLPHTLKHIHVDASCQDGVDKDVCEICNQEFNVTVLEANGEHSWKHVIVKPATCAATGIEKDVCENCSAEQNNKITPKTNDHHYEGGVCTVCGAKDPNKPGESKPASNGCGSSVGGGAALSLLAAAAFVVIKKIKSDK